MRRLLRGLMLPLSGLLLSVSAQAADKPDTPTLDAALKTAVERKAPVLIDFQAPWCYSCYYMARHVLVGPKWHDIEQRTVVVELDADSPEGAYWKTLWGVKALPSYVILKPDGAELGRILAEQRPDEFYAQVNQILKRSTTLDDLKAAAAGSGATALKAVREALAVYRARYDDGGLAWYATLPTEARKRYDADPAVALLIQRLKLLKASKANDVAACQSIAPVVFAGDLSCERPYEIDRWAVCTDGLPEDQRKAVFQSQVAPMKQLADQRVFGSRNAICADQRSVVLALADVYEGTGQFAERDALLRKAVAQVAARAEGKLADDRNAADNWRVFLEVLKDNAALDALYPKLIAAYPDDYVYPFRYGRNLLERGDAARALLYLEQASAKAYGQNRLKVAEQRVKALKLLKRDADARVVVAEALKANGPWFPEDAARLKAAL
ncbi:Thioredoxin-like [Hydrocarboniphaga daqingensis]|uniref:Thioredoxin-like n=1 Tax=Hydrocarboniphaga daqingensis TaxID=490188 RepID=A0A1M5JWE1_9GAMM|nr:thioredoxin family protein [Hydrocarboniphaga daqingensis]SHG44858.1 Thioredoxin-like [Hydrocarboniphaga daqingensis]